MDRLRTPQELFEIYQQLASIYRLTVVKNETETAMNDFNGNHTTPKQLAEQVLMDAISCRLEFIDESQEIDHLTDKQKEQVYGQVYKVAKRLAKQLHFDPDSFLWS